jgi:hypothetical protein
MVSKYCLRQAGRLRQLPKLPNPARLQTEYSEGLKTRWPDLPTSLPGHKVHPHLNDAALEDQLSDNERCQRFYIFTFLCIKVHSDCSIRATPHGVFGHDAEKGDGICRSNKTGLHVCGMNFNVVCNLNVLGIFDLEMLIQINVPPKRHFIEQTASFELTVSANRSRRRVCRGLQENR